MTFSEDEKLQILQHYVGGKVRSPEHSSSPRSKVLIRELKNQGYLRCGITPTVEETIKTTEKGLIYLEAHGIQADAPQIAFCRLCR